jgi:cytochrome c biogenesis protein
MGGPVTQKNRLGLDNPTFRGNMPIPEGSSSNTAIIGRQNGILIQDLPFSISLKKFIIEHYSTGMPKLFASDVVVTDHENGKSFPATIKVNEPLIYKGVAVYQSSFDDGGSRLKLVGWPMVGPKRATFALNGEVNGSTPLKGEQGIDYTIEWSGFRAFNVENVANGQDVRAVNVGKSFAERLDKQLGSAAKNANNKDLKNVGPSVQYKLRDKTGQAREYHNYMQPVLLDGDWVFLTGMRESPADPFQYLRIPADDNDTVEEWMRIRAALADPDMRAKAAERYADRVMPRSRENGPVLHDQLRESALKGMSVFAGEGQQAGYVAVARFIEKIPATDQEKAAALFMKILNGGLWDLWQVAREKDGLKPAEETEKHARFMQLAANALSDANFYGAPVYLQLAGFDEVKASVLQVTRSPGKKVVYLGCLLLVLGVFSMFYIRERRLWVWFKSAENGGTHALMAVSTQRRTLDFDKEFEQLKLRLTQP